MSDVGENASRLWRARASLVALFALFFVPVLVSMVLVIAKPGWTPFGTINRGELIQPPLTLNLSGGLAKEDEVPLPKLLAGKWVLAHLSPTVCGEDCNRALVAMRQARIALGKDADRVLRLWLVTDDVAPVRMNGVLEEFPGLHAYRASLELAKQFPRPSHDALYVIDPAGLLILRYEGTESANDILKDMKRLLKISKQG